MTVILDAGRAACNSVNVKHVMEQISWPITEKSPHDDFFSKASLQQVLAMLVNGVYIRDRKALFHIPLLTKKCEVDERTDHYTRYWTRMEFPWITPEEEAKLGVKHYLRKDNHPNPHAPRLVIAIRGTIPRLFQDIVDDLRIADHTLHTSSRFEECQNLVETIIKTYFHNNKYESLADVCITGHSLGAAIALQVGKHLAIDEHLETEKKWYSGRYTVHCFNPPFLTFVQLVQQSLLLERTKAFLHKLDPLKPILRIGAAVKDNVKMLASVCMFKHFDHLMDELRHFTSLVDWLPVLYVNKHDRICKKYFRFFERRHCSFINPVSTQAMISVTVKKALGCNAKYCSLVPSVTMYISMQQDTPHALANWYADPRQGVKVEIRHYRVLGRGFPDLPMQAISFALANVASEILNLRPLNTPFHQLRRLPGTDYEVRELPGPDFEERQLSDTDNFMERQLSDVDSEDDIDYVSDSPDSKLELECFFEAFGLAQKEGHKVMQSRHL